MAAAHMTIATEIVQAANMKAPAGQISLVVSDVDGTLVTPVKQLTEASIAAAHRLHDAGIAFTIVSSRPPRGLAMLTAPLGLQQPFAAYNGATIVRPDLSPIEEHLVPSGAARIAIDVIGKHGAGVWLFSGPQWLLTDPDGAYVGLERRTLMFEPTVVSGLDRWLDRAGKIVGVSQQFDMLTRCESSLRRALDGIASVRRSQHYYLDVTHPVADKGYAARQLAAFYGVALEEVAVVGDMANDLPMFTAAGLAIAMGNASPEVKASAHFVTRSNSEDGFAAAVDQFILPRAVRGRSQK
jgi:Cof subfamily protein (haloacid dehalogenase superfamily)